MAGPGAEFTRIPETSKLKHLEILAWQNLSVREFSRSVALPEAIESEIWYLDKVFHLWHDIFV